MDDYYNMLKYFGEENSENKSEIFEIMTNFVSKFEVNIERMTNKLASIRISKQVFLL